MVALCGVLAACIDGAGATGAAASQASVVSPASTALPDAFTTTITVNPSWKVVGGITDHYVGL